MSFAYSASPYNNNEEGFTNSPQIKSTINEKKIERNKTLRKANTNKVKEMLDTINNSNKPDIYKIDDEGEDLVGFNPPVYPQSATLNKKMINEDTTLQTKGPSDKPVTIESFNSLPNTYSEDYQRQYVPYYNQMSQGTGNKDQLLEKLNYMIHLLEEQKEEKTGHIMEELILYSFLGVFMIFIVDSFARAGKYVR